LSQTKRPTADARQRVEIKSYAEWRRWLAKHHAQTDAIWLVRWKKDRGPYVSYDDIVDEAFCFGWIDSLPRVLDEDRTMLLLAPRKPKSAWSGVNKKRVARLIADKRMAAPGLAAIETAKANGAWIKLDGVRAPPARSDCRVQAASWEREKLHSVSAFRPARNSRMDRPSQKAGDAR